MTRVCTLTVWTIGLGLLLGACKNSTTTTGKQSIMYQKAIAYLQQQRSASQYQSKKIDVLIENLLPENVYAAKLGDMDLVLFDLKTYKNQSRQTFTHTYYKMSFPSKDGQTTGALIYTIHTNLTKDKIEGDIENILMYKSTLFTGEITTNDANDPFVQTNVMKNGRLQKSHHLHIGTSLNSIQSNARTANGDCWAYYLVTTTYFPDGHSEQESQYLFTICDPCNPTGQVGHLDSDCAPSGGSGGDTETNTIETTTISETGSEVDETDGAAPPIQYNYHSIVTRRNEQVIEVIIDPTTVSNPVAWYIDTYGRNTTRTITLFGHYNTSINGLKKIIAQQPFTTSLAAFTLPLQKKFRNNGRPILPSPPSTTKTSGRNSRFCPILSKMPPCYNCWARHST